MNKIRISEKHTYTILIFTLISIVSCITLNIFLFYGFLASIIVASCFLIRNGFSLTELLVMMKKGILECKSLFILVVLIGAMISIWMASGVVPTMLYYGLKYMQGTNFLFTSFILTTIVSICMGTALGTVTSVGIALLGLAKIFGVPNYILLGAIVSGAYVGDKCSPISSLFNLTLESIKVSYKETFTSISKTLLPTCFISGLIYYLIGKQYILVASNSYIDNFISDINKHFVVSPLLLLLPLSIIVMSFLGIKIVKSLFLILIAGIITAISLQKMSFNYIIASIFTGYKASTSSSELNSVLTSGGIISMVSILLIIAGAVSLIGLFQETNLITPVIEKITQKIKSSEELIIKTGLISSALTAISDQSVAILMPVKLLKDKYSKLNVKNTTLARTISDTGIIIAPLIPWNGNSLFIAITTGIPTITYAPYALLCYMSPLITFIFAYTHKFQNIKQKKDVQIKDI